MKMMTFTLDLTTLVIIIAEIFVYLGLAVRRGYDLKAMKTLVFFTFVNILTIAWVTFRTNDPLRIIPSTFCVGLIYNLFEMITRCDDIGELEWFYVMTNKISNVSRMCGYSLFFNCGATIMFYLLSQDNIFPIVIPKAINTFLILWMLFVIVSVLPELIYQDKLEKHESLPEWFIPRR